MLLYLPAGQWERGEQPVALFTQTLCIIEEKKARLYTAFVCSHWTKQHQHKAAPVCHFIQHASVVNQKRRDSTHHDIDICVLFSSCFLIVPTVNLNMYLRSVYIHINAAMMCCG